MPVFPGGEGINGDAKDGCEMANGDIVGGTLIAVDFDGGIGATLGRAWDAWLGEGRTAGWD